MLKPAGSSELACSARQQLDRHGRGGMPRNVRMHIKLTQVGLQFCNFVKICGAAQNAADQYAILGWQAYKPPSSRCCAAACARMLQQPCLDGA